MIKKSKYTNNELLDITEKLSASEKANYDKNNALWGRSEKDKSLIKRKYYAQVEEMLEARIKREKQTENLF